MILAIEPVLKLLTLTVLSPGGRCYTFDDRANGYSGGQGCGVVLVKRLHDVVRDGDTMRVVIRSMRSNRNDHTPGVIQPSGHSQASLMKETYEKVTLDVGHTRYFEAHAEYLEWKRLANLTFAYGRNRDCHWRPN